MRKIWQSSRSQGGWRSKNNDYNQADIDRLVKAGEKLKHELSMLQLKIKHTEDPETQKQIYAQMEELREEIRLKTDKISEIRKKNKS
jgi:hypothetical protein